MIFQVDHAPDVSRKDASRKGTCRAKKAKQRMESNPSLWPPLSLISPGPVSLPSFARFAGFARLGRILTAKFRFSSRGAAEL